MKMPAAKAKTATKLARQTKISVNGVTPFLWFNKEAMDAAAFYVSLLKGSKIVSKNPMGCEFELAGQRFMALNGGPHYKLNPAFSFYVSVTTQEQVDALWNALTKDGGEESMCGWLVDKYGVSWQIIPDKLIKYMWDKDAKKSQRVVDAMMKMQKIDIKTLERAYAGK